MPKKRQSASDLLRELERDPAYQARIRERDDAIAHKATLLRADERLLVEEIRKAGYHVGSVWDLVNNAPHPFVERRFVGPYPNAYAVLLRHLLLEHHPVIREGIVRALTVRDGGKEVEEALLAAFDHERDPHFRFVLANALKCAMPYSRRRRRPDIAAAYRGAPGA